MSFWDDLFDFLGDLFGEIGLLFVSFWVLVVVVLGFTVYWVAIR